MPAAGGHPRHARGFRMKDGRAHAHHPRRQDDHVIRRRKCQHDQPGQRDAHAHDERVGLRMLIRVEPDDRLKNRAHHLKRQRDEADLREGQPVRCLQHRIDGRDERLDGVVQQMGKAEREQHRHRGGRGGVHVGLRGGGRHGLGLGFHLNVLKIKNPALCGSRVKKIWLGYFLSCSPCGHRMERFSRPWATTLAVTATAPNIGYMVYPISNWLVWSAFNTAGDDTSNAVAVNRG